MTYIFVVGDSITYGAWDFERGGWVQRLRTFLDKKVEENPKENFFVVYNLGIDGHSTEDWVKVFEAEIETRMKIVKKYKEKAIIILALGANDALFVVDKKENNIPIDKFKANMKKLIALSKKFTENVICLGIPPCRASESVNYDDNNFVFSNEDIIKYNLALKSVTQDKKLPLIDIFLDIFYEVKKIKKFASFDGGHLTSEGHQKIFEIVKNYLSENELL